MRKFELFARSASLLSVLTIFLTSMACTRSGSGSAVTVALPDLQELARLSASKAGNVQASSAQTTGRIIINVTGAGITTPIQYLWISEENPGASAPSKVSLSVPAGKDRLVQVLAVVGTSESGNGVDSIYYGDTTSSVGGTESNVTVSLTALQSTTGAEGFIEGRYLNADGTGPTGRVAVQLKIPNKPSLTVDYAPILGGWFHFFAHENLTFSYVVESTGKTLFDSVNLNSTSLLSADDAATTSFDERMRTARVSIPGNYYYTYTNGGTPLNVRSYRRPRKGVIGFFGPGAGTRWMCYPSVTSMYSGLYTTNDVNNYANITWAGTADASATAAGIENVSGIGKGGVPSSNSTRCSGTAGEFENRLTLSFSTNGGYLTNTSFSVIEAPGFKTLERTFYSPNGYSMSSSTNPLQLSSFKIVGGQGRTTLNWEYLPGVVAESGVVGVIDGARVFVRDTVVSNDSSDVGGDGRINCSALVSKGFSEVGRVLATSGVRAQSFEVTGISPLKYYSGAVQIAVCPYKDVAGVPVYSSAGVGGNSAWFTSGYSQLELARIDGSSAQSQAIDECVGYKIRSTDYRRGDKPVASNLSITLKASERSGFVYNDASCSGSVIAPTNPVGTTYEYGTFPIASGNFESSTFYVKIGSVTSFGLTLDSGSTNYSGGYDLRVRYAEAASTYIARLQGPTSLVTDQCYQAELVLGGSNATATNISDYPAARSLDQTFTISSNFTAYEGNGCYSQSNQTVTLPAGTISKIVWLKPVTAGASQVLSATRTTADGGTMTQLSSTGMLVEDPILHHFTANFSGSMDSSSFIPGSCGAVNISAMTVNNNSLYSQAYPVTVSVSGATFYSDSACTTSVASPISMTAGAMSSPVFMKPNAEVDTISLSGSDGNGHSLSTYVLQAQVPRRFAYRRANYSPITSVMKNYCQPMTVELQKSDSTGFYAYGTPTVPEYTYEFTSPNASFYLYSDSSCGTLVPNHRVTFKGDNNSSNQKTIYVKFWAATSSTVEFKATNIDFPTVSAVASLDWIDLDHFGLSYTATDAQNGNMKLGALDSSNNFVQLSEPINIRLVVSAGSHVLSGLTSNAIVVPAGWSYVYIGVSTSMTGVSSVTGQSITNEWFLNDPGKVTGGSNLLPSM